MDLAVTLAGLAVAAVILAAAMIISRRPVEPGDVRMLPYGGIQFVAIVAIIVALAHLMSLLTGQPFTSRFGL